ncbi:MAG: hypothetical protein AAF171_11880 [Cyanobacteria bacterium P01_A01_bin.116]
MSTSIRLLHVYGCCCCDAFLNVGWAILGGNDADQSLEGQSPEGQSLEGQSLEDQSLGYLCKLLG